MTIRRVVGIYDADGGFRGEAASVIGSLFGRRHCSLCDITHSGVRRRHSWDDLLGRLELPMDVVHRNELPEFIGGPPTGDLPIVIGLLDDSDPPDRGGTSESTAGPAWVMLLSATELEACEGSVDSFEQHLRAALERHRSD